MSLNNITFVLGQGGLGRPLPGQDYISGLLFFTDNLPSGFSSSSRVKQIFSVADAEALGIVDTYADATAAEAEYEVTAIGANGDTLSLKVAELNGAVVEIAAYTKVSGDSTVTLVATAIKNLINAGTNVHGYTATNVAGVITIVAPKRLGIFLNTGTPLSATIQGTITGTATQFTGGVASELAVFHYHISEYFRLQPQGNLYVGLYDVPDTYNYVEITAMQTAANGTIRQVGVFKPAALAANGGDLTALDVVCKANAVLHKELIALLGANISATSDLSTLYDMSLLTANTAALVISQDGGALGATLYLTTGASVTNLGALLGAVSLAKVSENIAWVAKFNISNGIENDVVAFANGDLWTEVTASNENLVSALQDRRYIFLRKFIGVAGSYFNDDLTAINASSDYCFISNNRTIQKATRGVYSSLVPSLNSPLVLNANGTLAETTIAYLQSQAETNLLQMVRDGELSAQQVVINPAQNVLSTSKLVITINLVPIGSARNIQVNIGFNVAIN